MRTRSQTNAKSVASYSRTLTPLEKEAVDGLLSLRRSSRIATIPTTPIMCVSSSAKNGSVHRMTTRSRKNMGDFQPVCLENVFVDEDSFSESESRTTQSETSSECEVISPRMTTRSMNRGRL
jgi:hypothetical protein